MELMDLASFFNSLATYFIIVPISIGLFFFKKLSGLTTILVVGLMLLFLHVVIASYFEIKIICIFIKLNSLLII